MSPPLQASTMLLMRGSDDKDAQSFSAMRLKARVIQWHSQIAPSKHTQKLGNHQLSCPFVGQRDGLPQDSSGWRKQTFLGCALTWLMRLLADRSYHCHSCRPSVSGALAHFLLPGSLWSDGVSVLIFSAWLLKLSQAISLSWGDTSGSRIQTQFCLHPELKVLTSM